MRIPKKSEKSNSNSNLAHKGKNNGRADLGESQGLSWKYRRIKWIGWIITKVDILFVQKIRGGSELTFLTVKDVEDPTLQLLT